MPIIRVAWLLAILLVAAVPLTAAPPLTPPTTSFCEADDCGSLPPLPGEGGSSGGGGGNDTYTLGSPYDTCNAYRVYRQHCTDCTYNQYMKCVCSWVDFTASCMCEQKQRAGAGPGITDCVTYNSSCFYYP